MHLDLPAPEIDLALCRKFFLRFYFLALFLWQHRHLPANMTMRNIFPEGLPWMLQSELAESFNWRRTDMCVASVKSKQDVP